jgi:APA family basic amino acid/polyamine antiporter
MRRGADVRLRRVLNAALGVAIVVGGSIGIGILGIPGVVAGKIGSPPLLLFAWILGGVLVLLGANIYAELATAFPQAGGPYVYVKRVAGPFGGFATGWSDIVVSIVASAAQAAIIGEYLESEQLDRRVIAVAVLLILGAVNWFGLKVGARAQQALSLFKVGGLLLLAVVCLAIGGFELKAHSISTTSLTLAGFISGLMLISETYAGWNSSVYFSEEDKDTDRNVPRALFWGTGAMMATYVLVNAGLLAALTIPQLAASKLPAANAIQVIFGDRSAAVVQAFAIVSVVGIMNVGIMYTPRVLFAMGRDGVLPKGFTSLNSFGTPSWALVACTLPPMVLAIFHTFDFLFAVTAFLGLAIDAAAYVALFVLRRTAPDVRRPYRARWYPWAPGLVTLISIGLLVGFMFTDPRPTLWAVVAIALSWPVYQWMRWKYRASPVAAAE